MSSYSIIGSGAIGSALAGHFASKGIEVLLANNRGPASLEDLVRKLGPKVRAATVKDAAKADIVILAVPWAAYADAVAGIAPWGGRIVIDAMNAASIGPEGFRPFDLGGRPSSQVVADRLTGARVVKAFNTLLAAVLASDPHTNGGRRMLFISGEDAPAKQEVATLIDRFGFVAIDLGDFEMGRRLQQFPTGPLAGINVVQFP
jgi:8-hydroxy-5-deazaflavin:NADPH oxidoreductase